MKEKEEQKDDLQCQKKLKLETVTRAKKNYFKCFKSLIKSNLAEKLMIITIFALKKSSLL